MCTPRSAFMTTLPGIRESGLDAERLSAPTFSGSVGSHGKPVCSST